MKRGIWGSLGRIDYRLLGTLLLMGLLPTLYTTLRIFFLGSLTSDWGFNIASQLSWVNLAYEVLQEGLLLPLFFLMGQVYANRSELENRLRTGLVVVATVYGTLAMAIWTFVEPATVFMSQKAELVPATIAYIRLETLASLLSVMVQFVTLVLITLRKQGLLLVILAVQMVLSMVGDTLLVSTLPFSAQLGVNGIAVTNILVNGVLLVLVVVLFLRLGYHVFSRQAWSFAWLGAWLKVGGYSGLESLVRNLAFMLMVVRMVNVVGEQGTFWTANSFLWNWLLLPVLQLGQLIKRDAGTGGMPAVRSRLSGYFVLTAAIVVVWAGTLPGWDWFLATVMNLGNHTQVLHIVLLSVGFYVLFAFNNVVDSLFYGLGKTNYLLFQSVVINTVFYGTLYGLYLVGLYQPTLEAIALMFALGIAVDSLLTFAMFLWFLRREQRPAATGI